MKPGVIFFFTGVFFIGLIACKKKNPTNQEEPAESFDKQALLVNMADNVILPDYNAFKLTVDSLTTAFNTFKTSGQTADFQVVKQKFNSAYRKYQHVSPYEFGPAETQIVRMNCNVFPTDSSLVLANISSGSYNLSSAANFDAKGFPALDYLFYGNNRSEAGIIALFSGANRKQYVSDIISDISSKINAVVSEWNASYREKFVNSLNTTIGSSIGNLVNQLNFEMDYLKNAKIGTPLGKKSLGIILPDKCEAYYSNQSGLYAMETLISIENIYLGRGANGSDGKGFDDYLDFLNAQYNGGSLNQAIKNQIATAKTKLGAITNLKAQLVSSPAIVDAAYTELLKLLVLLKTDMPSSLGVVITYQDGDGD